MRRVVLGLMFAAVSLAPSSMRAQEDGSIGAILYLGVSVGSLVRLLEPGVTLRAGDVVRLQRWHDPDVIGTLASVSADAVTLTVRDSARVIPRADIRRIHRFDGIERKWAQGWGIGFLSGAAVGATLGFVVGGDQTSGDLDLTRGEAAAVLGIVGAFTGSGLGAILGSFNRGEHWRATHPLPASLAITPARGGTRLGLRFSF